MTIAMNALREKLRRKELYCVAVIGVLVILLFSTGVGSISLNGVAITEYSVLAPILLVVVNVICGILAIVLSLKTIPNEYERRTSHLVWIRGISQARYHGELAFANILSSMFAAGIMYVGIAIFAIVKGEGARLLNLIPSYLVLCISVALVSLVTSVLSIKLPTMAAGVIAAAFLLLGTMQGMLSMLTNMVQGVMSTVLKYVFIIIPDLNAIQTQAGAIISGHAVEVHEIFKGLLMLYLITLLVFVVKRKEA